MTALKLTRNPDLVAARVDEDLVMMSVENGRYFSINSLGGRIWELLEGSVTINEIVKAICEEYDVSEDVCRSDVTAFVKQLSDLGFVKSV